MKAIRCSQYTQRGISYLFTIKTGESYVLSFSIFLLIVSYIISLFFKNYNAQFRSGFAEALLAKRILITEGNTESILYPAVARRLSEINSKNYSSLEAMGVAVFNAESENNISFFGELFQKLGKEVFAVFDQQKKENLEKIKNNVLCPYEIPYKGIENLILQETDSKVLMSFYEQLEKDNEIPINLGQVIENHFFFIRHNFFKRSHSETYVFLSGKHLPEWVGNI